MSDCNCSMAELYDEAMKEVARLKLENKILLATIEVQSKTIKLFEELLDE